MLTQDGIGQPLNRDRASTIRARTALWFADQFTPSIRTLLAASLPANDVADPWSAA